MRRFFRTLCLGIAATMIAATSFAEGRDVTAQYLRNADMEQGVKYWALEGERLLIKNTKNPMSQVGFHGMDQGVLEAWNGNFDTPIGDSRTLQKMYNMPNGTYVFGAYVGATLQNARAMTDENVYEYWSNRSEIYGVSLFANGNEVRVATDNLDFGYRFKWAHSSKFNVATTVTDGTLEVGLKVAGTNANYVVWDNATLYYFGDMSEAEALDAMAENDMVKAVEVAGTLLDVKMNVDTLCYLDLAIEHANQVTTTAATLWDDNEELYWAIGLARRSVADYANLLADIEAARTVADGTWSDASAFYVDILNEVIGEAEEAYDEAQLNRPEVAAMRKALRWSAGDVKYDSLYIALGVLNEFIDEARNVEGLPGGYTTVQVQSLRDLYSEVEDAMIEYEEDAEREMEERTVDPNGLYPYIAQVYAAIENVKNNPISTEYTKMPIEFRQAENGWIEGAEWFDESAKIIAYTSPMYRFEGKVETFRITVNKNKNNARYFCLSELEFFDGHGQKIELTEDDITSNADHNTLNPDAPDGGGIAALFDDDYNSFFHSAWRNMPTEAHYLEVTLPNGGYDAFSFRMLSRSNSNGWSQSHTFPGEMVIATPAPEREKLELLITRAKTYNAYSFPEVGYYYKDYSYLLDAIAQAEALIKNYASEEECEAMSAKLQQAVMRFEADEEKAIRLPEAGKAYRLVSAFTNFYEMQSVEKAITINTHPVDSTQVLWWEDVRLDHREQEFVFEPIMQDDEPYVEIEYFENSDGAENYEVYYCYHVKNLATGLYVGYDPEMGNGYFSVTAEPSDTIRLKSLGRGQWNIMTDGRTFHCGDHNSGNVGSNNGAYGGTWGVGSAIVSWMGGLDGASAWYIREMPEFPLSALVDGAEFRSEYVHFEASDVFTLSADKPCAFADMALYDLYGNPIAIDELVVEGRVATIRLAKKLVGCSFAFTNHEGVSLVVIDLKPTSDVFNLLRAAYDKALAFDPQVGNDVMQYADISAYTAALARAAAMIAAGASDEEALAMIDALEGAVASLVPNMPIPDRMYYIVSAMDAFAEKHGVGMMIYDDNNGQARWTYENLYDLNRCWMFEPAEGEEGYYLKNVGTGMYLGAAQGSSYQIDMVYEKYETTPYTITSLGGDVAAIASSENEYYKLHAMGHASGAGRAGTIVYWNSGAGTASAWRICDAEVYGLQAFSGNAMKAQNVETKPSTTITIPIVMENSTAVTAFQFDLYLPSGVRAASSYVDGVFSYDIAYNEARVKSSHVVDAEPQGDGSLRVVGYSASNAAYMGSGGVLVNIAVDVFDIEDGVYNVTINNIRLVTADGSEIACPATTSTLTIKSTSPGDVNGDDQFTMSDVVMMVNAVLQKPQTNFDASVADMNGDGEITMGDVVRVLRLVLTGGRAMAPERSAEAAAVAMPVLSAGEPVTLGEGRVALPIALDNSEAYSAFQLDVVLPAGVELTEATLTERAKAAHTIAWHRLPNGRVRIVAYALNNAAFRGNEGDMIHLVLSTSSALMPDATIGLTDGLFATQRGAEHRAGDISVTMRSHATHIDHARGFSVCGADGAIEIECGAATVVSIHSAIGQLVSQPMLTAGKHTIALPAGVYVVNGNKVIVK